MPLERFRAIDPAVGEDVYHDLQSRVAVARRKSLGGTGFDQVKAQVTRARQLLGEGE